MARIRILAIVLVLSATASVSRGGEAKTDLYGDPLPPGAVARLGTIRLRHADADVVFSKDGKHLISCGRNGEVRIWSVATGRLVRRLRLDWKPRKHEWQPAVALSPDGVLAALWSGEKTKEAVRLFDTNTGRERGRFSAPNGGRYLIFSPDGKQLAVQEILAGDQYTVQIWDVSTLKKRQTLRFPLTALLSRVTFSSDGKKLAGIIHEEFGKEKLKVARFNLFQWDAATGQVICKKVNLPPMDEDALAFSPDGTILAVGAQAKGVRLLEAATLKPKALLQPAAKIHPQSFFSHLAFSPNGRWLAVSYMAPNPIAEAGILLWDVAEAKEIRRLPARSETRLVFAPDGRMLVGHDASTGIINLWDAATGRALHQRPSGGGRWIRATSPDGNRIVAWDDEGFLLRLWDAATGKSIRSLDGYGACRFAPDGRRLYVVDQPGPHDKGNVAFRIVDVSTGQTLRRIDIPGGSVLSAFAVGADGRRLAAVVSMGDGLGHQLVVYDADSGAQRIQRPYKVRKRVEFGPQGGNYAVHADHAAFAPDGESVIVWLGDRLGIEETATGNLRVKLPADVRAPVIFSPDGRFAAATAIRQVKTKEAVFTYDIIGLSFLETASGEEIFRVEEKAIQHVAFTRDGRGVVVVDNKGLHVLDIADGRQLHQRTWPDCICNAYGDAEICSVALLSGARLATGMQEGGIFIWDLSPASWTIHQPMRKLERKELEALWSDLGDKARAAYRALAMLTDAPAQAVPFLKDRLQPMMVDKKRIDALLADLDSAQFATRQAANRKLIELRESIETVLRRKLDEKPTLEVRRRIQAILAEPRPMTADVLRTRRAIAVLERINTPESRDLLQLLSGNAAAQAALQRLKRR